MKILLMTAVLAGSPLLLGACQNHPDQRRDEFNAKTHRQYNPETGSFEQVPPWGKQSNKATDSGQ
ncbi:MAG TPA: hypothetical protein VHY22_01600 [Chthoniobacteraceae bacterium]|jgi:hypothetical protein|nr:hypothetical protein [Chthoniobacteraceae bacterium]